MIECVDCEEYLREIDRLESRLAAALDALREIRDELGVPQPGYPAPVANAARIARAFLAGGGRADCLCPWPEQDESPRHTPECVRAAAEKKEGERGK